MANVARAVGMKVGDIPGARILEIGCATGHHLLSLASRWPEAKCTGIDISGKAISRASSLAKRAGLANVRLHECRLGEFEPEGEFDFIIAHGFFSWVADEVKVRLLDFMGKCLSPEGMAVVSFNVASGWKARMPVVEKTLAIQAAGKTDEISALEILKTVAEAGETSIIRDMLSKGADVLAFDDFAPVMDAWSLGAVRKLAEENGLRWLGDSVTGERGTDTGDDEAGTTFRSELFCREDADLSPEASPVTRKESPRHEVPVFPKLNPWRMVCVLEGLPVPDEALRPCAFSVPQLLVMSRMDGSNSHVRLAALAKENAPDLHFVPFLRHIAGRGFFT